MKASLRFSSALAGFGLLFSQSVSAEPPKGWKVRTDHQSIPLSKVLAEKRPPVRVDGAPAQKLQPKPSVPHGIAALATSPTANPLIDPAPKSEALSTLKSGQAVTVNTTLPADTDDSGTDHPLIQNPAPNLFAHTLYKGLLAPVGSAARKAAGEALQKELDAAYALATPETDEFELSEQALTRKVFQMTIDYMKSDSVCAPEQRVRLYRGIGAQPLVRPPGAKSGGFQIFMDPMINMIAGLIVGGKVNQQTNTSLVPERDVGELAHYHLDEIAKNLTRPFDWSKLLVNRTSWGAQGKLNLRWYLIGNAHTGMSQDSPLISTTIDPTHVSGYGPATMILDVCPERILPSNQKTGDGPFMGESEFYLPLVTFPEEDVRTAGLECTRPKADGTTGGPGCGWQFGGGGGGGGPVFFEPSLSVQPFPGGGGGGGAYVFADQDPVTPMTSKFRRMFSPTGHAFEQNYINELSFAATFHPDNKGAENKNFEFFEQTKERYFQLQDAYYELYKKEANDLTSWRVAIDSFKADPDCKVAQNIVTQGRRGMEMLLEKTWGANPVDDFSHTQNLATYSRLKPAYKDFGQSLKPFCQELELGAELPEPPQAPAPPANPQ